MIKIILVILALVTVVFAYGCAPIPPTESKVEYSTEQVCQDLGLFLTSLNKLLSESSFTTSKELQAQVSVVQQNFANLVQSMANLDETKLNAMQTAVQNFGQAAVAIPEGTSVGEAINQLKEPIAEVQKAGKDIQTSLQCK